MRCNQQNKVRRGPAGLGNKGGLDIAVQKTRSGVRGAIVFCDLYSGEERSMGFESEDPSASLPGGRRGGNEVNLKVREVKNSNQTMG